VGWRDWLCQYEPNIIKYREFDKGFIVGMFRFSHNIDHGQVFIIQNGTWESRNTDIKAAECKAPVWLVETRRPPN
jgi:hypothetical protein